MAWWTRLSQQDDDALMAKVATGSERAFREIVERYQARIYDYARRTVHDGAEAADIAQETFFRLFRQAGRYQGQSSLKGYLFCIARNLCIDHMRRKRPIPVEHVPEQADETTPFVEVDVSDRLRQLEEALESLPETQRTALLLRHREELGNVEIAEAMETTVSAVESLLVRGRKGLHKILPEDFLDV